MLYRRAFKIASKSEVVKILGNRRINIRDGNGKKKCVGIVEDGVYKMERKYSKHYFKKLEGWAVDEKVARGLTDVETFELTDLDTKSVLRVSRETFIEKALPLHYGGHRPQLLLESIHWEKVK